MSTSSTKAAVDSRVDPSHFAFCHPICTPQSLCCIALLIATAPTLRSVNYSNAQKKPPHTQPRQPATRRALEIATSPCDGVKCMSCDLNVCMSVSCSNGAKRCGGLLHGFRCEAMRCGAENTKRSDDDEEERGKHQRDPKVFTIQQTCHYLRPFWGATL